MATHNMKDGSGSARKSAFYAKQNLDQNNPKPSLKNDLKISSNSSARISKLGLKQDLDQTSVLKTPKGQNNSKPLRSMSSVKTKKHSLANTDSKEVNTNPLKQPASKTDNAKNNFNPIDNYEQFFGDLLQEDNDFTVDSLDTKPKVKTKPKTWEEFRKEFMSTPLTKILDRTLWERLDYFKDVVHYYKDIPQNELSKNELEKLIKLKSEHNVKLDNILTPLEERIRHNINLIDSGKYTPKDLIGELNVLRVDNGLYLGDKLDKDALTSTISHYNNINPNELSENQKDILLAIRTTFPEYKLTDNLNRVLDEVAYKTSEAKLNNAHAELTKFTNTLEHNSYDKNTSNITATTVPSNRFHSKNFFKKFSNKNILKFAKKLYHKSFKSVKHKILPNKILPIKQPTPKTNKNKSSKTHGLSK